MPHYICETCGTQFAASEEPPRLCPICSDERQYVGLSGQKWTTMEKLHTDHKNDILHLEENLFGIGTAPSFAIGQRALLVRTPQGNILWDCISLIDDATIEEINKLGGLRAIAVSHPHYYGAMADWANAFEVPVFLHIDDQQWVMRHDPTLVFWDGETMDIGDGLTLVRAGGHFDGGVMLHWPQGDEGRGALLTGDIIQINPDRLSVSFMYSYPNHIPLSARKVRRIQDSVSQYRFDRMYGAFWHRVIHANGQDVLARSVDRYLRAIEDKDEESYSVSLEEGYSVMERI